jgi:hypothetical protein
VFKTLDPEHLLLTRLLDRMPFMCEDCAININEWLS